MSLYHKFLQHDFGHGYNTHNAILDTIPYKPEVMVIGTFNPDTPNDNFADFFYGRNFFWSGFKNLFIHNGVMLLKRRMPSNGVPPAILNPTLTEIFTFCSNLKLTFSDLVLKVLHNKSANFQLLRNDNVVFKQQEYNLIQDGRKGKIYGLQQLDAFGQIDWNTENIINYLCENPQIKTIYFTRRPTGLWATHWNAIINHKCMSGRLTANIFTPSCAGAPVNRSMARLLKHWVHNINPNFGRLDNNWLINKGVNIDNF